MLQRRIPHHAWSKVCVESSWNDGRVPQLGYKKTTHEEPLHHAHVLRVGLGELDACLIAGWQAAWVLGLGDVGAYGGQEGEHLLVVHGEFGFGGLWYANGVCEVMDTKGVGVYFTE